MHFDGKGKCFLFTADAQYAGITASIDYLNTKQEWSASSCGQFTMILIQ
jgi:hypothetical protein